ncbi:MAG: methyltransferase domain-containing protein [Wenzhouxiangella sp.]
MKLVELTGPTGAGKSVIYQHMLQHGGFVQNPTLTYEQAEEIVAQAMQAWPDIHDFVALWQYIFRTATGPWLEIRQSGTLRALAKVMLARGTSRPEAMVVDGGLIHRGWGIAQLEPAMPLRQYFETMPVPDLMVNVTCDLETLKERNRARGGSHDRSDLCELADDVAEMACWILARRGVPILHIGTTSTPPEENAQHILDAIRQLGENPDPIRAAADAAAMGRSFGCEEAEGYDVKREQSPKWIAEQKIVEEMLSDLPERSVVLDIPCGTGRFLDFYHKRRLRVIGMDASADMIAQATKKVPEPLAMLDGKAQFSFRQGDVRDIKLPVDSVDAAVMVRMTRWLSPDDCQKAFRELQHVARDRIILTARIEHERPDLARPVSMFSAAQQPGWLLTRDEPAGDETYRVLMYQRKADA